MTNPTRSSSSVPRTGDAIAPAPRPSTALTVWTVLVFSLALGGAALLGLGWLATRADGTMIIYVWLTAITLAVPCVLLAVAAVVLIILAARARRRGMLALAIASLVCHVPLMVTALVLLSWFGH
ncbi:MAG: hypothetical protein QM677_11390 [Microbacterium sp.]